MKTRMMLACVLSLCALSASGGQALAAGQALDAGMPPGAEPVCRLLYNKTRQTTQEPVERDGVLYLPLREICDDARIPVYWDQEKKLAAVERDGAIIPAAGLLRNGVTLVPVSFVTDKLKLSVQLFPDINAVSVAGPVLTEGQALADLPLFKRYSKEDYIWLSRIVEAEAKGETYSSRLGVASVVLNRLKDPAYPDTVKEVVFDHSCGVQFTPTANGSIYNQPSALSCLAALDALEGKNDAPGALFFVATRAASSSWAQHNRQYAFAIGGHSYYY